MTPIPDCGEDSYVGTGQLEGKVAVITGADSGIGRAVAIAYAREGADVLISYLSEDSDAEEVRNYVEKAGRRAVLVRGDVSKAQHCRDIVGDLGRRDCRTRQRAAPEQTDDRPSAGDGTKSGGGPGELPPS